MAIVGPLALFVVVSLMSTTRESRRVAWTGMARWNPYFLSINIVLWGFIVLSLLIG